MPFGLRLLKTAHQRLVDYERAHVRAARRSVERELPLPDKSSVDQAQRLVTTSRSPADEAVHREQGRAVRCALAQLNETDRAVLLLRVFDGLKNAEVAACCRQIVRLVLLACARWRPNHMSASTARESATSPR
jgi:DNA-directed RNA polymerase specialized sigma24 family protein